MGKVISKIKYDNFLNMKSELKEPQDLFLYTLDIFLY
jgi:hypothetical protein